MYNKKKIKKKKTEKKEVKGSSPVREPEMKGENLEKCLQNQDFPVQ